jgi:glycine/D-amino acid oxidase-like deaminating enzyme
LQKGIDIMVYSDEEVSASHVAAGMYNPVTGKRMTKTWRANELFPFMETFYKTMESDLGTTILFPKTIYKPFASIEEQNTWMSAIDDFEYVDTTIPKEKYENYLHGSIGGYETFHSGHVDVLELINAFRKKLEKTNAYARERIDFEAINFTENGVVYKGIKAKKIIFCEGVYAQKNPYFHWLPFYPSKGELIEVYIPQFNEEVIFNKQVFVLPYQSGCYKVGSTYVWEYSHAQPTEAARQELTTKLSQFIKMPFTVSNHKAGIRPTVKDRKPLIGLHPIHKQLAVFNGLGTKGVSLAPFFAAAFVDYLLGKKQLNQEVDIERFYSLYSRS